MRHPPSYLALPLPVTSPYLVTLPYTSPYLTQSRVHHPPSLPTTPYLATTTQSADRMLPRVLYRYETRVRAKEHGIDLQYDSSTIASPPPSMHSPHQRAPAPAGSAAHLCASMPSSCLSCFQFAYCISAPDANCANSPSICRLTCYAYRSCATAATTTAGPAAASTAAPTAVSTDPAAATDPLEHWRAHEPAASSTATATAAAASAAAFAAQGYHPQTEPAALLISQRERDLNLAPLLLGVLTTAALLALATGVYVARCRGERGYRLPAEPELLAKEDAEAAGLLAIAESMGLQTAHDNEAD